jgi:hypothetical protein
MRSPTVIVTFDLAPCGGSARAVGRVLALRDDALQSKLADVPEHVGDFLAFERSEKHRASLGKEILRTLRRSVRLRPAP